MNGLLRFVFYAGLLAFALRPAAAASSPLYAAHQIRVTDPLFYSPQGLMELVGLGAAHQMPLEIITGCVIVAWICAAVGFLLPFSAIFTGVGFAVLHGATAGADGVKHTWFLPVYTLLALGMSNCDDRWTVDYYLRRRFSWYPRAWRGVWMTGLARKYVLVAVVGLLFSAGAAKIINGGWAWFDGHSLQYYVARASGARWPALATLLVDNLWLCTLLSAATVFLEVGALAALFYGRARYAVVSLMIGLHVGIWFTMGLSFWPQVWCYLLVVEWPWEAGFHPQQERPPVRVRDRRMAAAFGSGYFGLLLCVAFFRIEWWPATYIPMYSEYRTVDQKRAANLVAAKEIALNAVARDTGIFAFHPGNFSLQLIPRAGGTPVPLRKLVKKSQLPALPAHFNNVLVDACAETLAMQSAADHDRSDGAPRRSPADRFLDNFVPRVRGHVSGWSRYGRIEIVAHFEDGSHVLAATELSEETTVHERSGRGGLRDAANAR